MTTLSRKQLDVAGCGIPNCGHDHTVLHLQSVCHPDAGTSVSYDKRTGLLTVKCQTCAKFITQVKVAKS